MRSPVARAVLVLTTTLALLSGSAATASAAAPSPGGSVRTEDLRIEVRDGPARDQLQSLDARWYTPAGAGPGAPAPAMLLAHGFGSTKDSLDTQARDLASRGYAVLAYTARGFGTSTGTIALNSPDAEVADAQGLLDWLAARPEVRLDGPGDPRVGVMGGSYGGALALLLAGVDRRVDAAVPMITWNDLSQALFPNAASTSPTPDPPTPAAMNAGPDGVFKQTWGGVFFGTGSSGPSGSAAPGTPLVCGRLAPEVCAGYVEAAATGRLPVGLASYLERSSPRSVADRITAPTLLVQGERDTLFGLDQADATARQIAGAGGRVAVAWFAGGHDSGQEPDDDTLARVQAWLDHYVAGTAPDPGTAFTYTVPSGVRARSAPTQRTVTAPAYPGLPGPSATAGPAPRLDLSLTGPAQDILAPAGGNPASVSNLPGFGALAGAGSSGQDDDSGGGGSGGSGGGSGGGGGGGGSGGASALLSRIAGDVPGQAATFSTAPLAERTTVSGSAQVRLTVAAVPGQPPPGEALLFGKVYDASAESGRTLLGNAVAPVRLPAPPPDGRPVEVTVSLPAVVATLAAGHRLEVAVATTDQAYARSATPSTFRIALAPGDGATLAVPSVPGEVRSGTSVPAGPLVAAGVLLLGVLAAVVAGRVVSARRRRRDREPGGDLAVDPALADVPLVVRGLGKAWPSGLRAVDDVSFRVERGQVLGLLGPNGAGKTTTLRMLLGLIRPSEGELRVFGVRVAPGAPVLGRVGAFVEGAGFLPHLSGRANLESYWDATGRPRDEARLSEALAIAGLGTAVDRAVRAYSQGMRQRLAIAQAMLGMPDLLVLDEPTNGLDPPQIHAMREVLRDYARSGPDGRARTVLVSSHLLAEVEQTCDHVVVMHRGAVVAGGPVAELVAGGQAALTLADPADRDEALRVARRVEGVTAASPDERADDVVLADLAAPPGTNGHGPPDPPEDASRVRARLVRALVDAGVDVVAVGPRRRLEDAFLALIAEGDGDAADTGEPVGQGARS